MGCHGAMGTAVQNQHCTGLVESRYLHRISWMQRQLHAPRALLLPQTLPHKPLTARLQEQTTWCTLERPHKSPSVASG
ncbi:hypothetical protein ABBQ32_005645 [Trebouxia sp. C0010 RCD-2024]